MLIFAFNVETMALPLTSKDPPSCGEVSDTTSEIPLVTVEAIVMVLASVLVTVIPVPCAILTSSVPAEESVNLKFAPPVAVSDEIEYVVLPEISLVNANVPAPPGMV